MCVIVDANLASDVFDEDPSHDFSPIRDWLERGDGCLVYGGRLADELAMVETARRLLVQLLRAGKARLIAEGQVAREEVGIAGAGHCKSNDLHVLALARISGARTLCTRDRNLQRDFLNPRVISSPRGNVYQRREHRGLLRHTPSSCGRGKRD